MNILTYVKDATALVKEVAEKYPELIEKDEEGNVIGVTLFHTPVQKDSNGCTLAYTMTNDNTLEIINNLDSIENLGDYDEMEADADKRAKYLSVWDYETPTKYLDEDGIEQEYYKPKKIGTFAGGE